MSWNPISINSWLYDFAELNPPENSRKIFSTFKDNPFLSKEYIEAMEDMRNDMEQKTYETENEQKSSQKKDCYERN